MTTRRARGASVRSGRTVLAGIVGIGLLLTAAACTSSSSDAASSSTASSASSEATSTTESGPAEASQVSDPSSSYSGAAPTVPSDGAPASGAGPSADAVTTTAPPVSTSGAASTSGDINQVVPNRELVTNSAVPLDAASDLGGQISAKLTEVKAIDAQAKVPGEISGPAVAITVEISNDSANAIGLDSVSVDVQGAGGVPTSPITTDPASPLSGVLAPGEKKTGVYVFTMPADVRNGASVTVLYSADAPVALFTGNVPTG
jgi:hypothetical protein